MKRKKILILSDSSKLHTGFGRVTKEIFTYLNKTNKYEIAQIGWFHQNTNEDVTYPIWMTNTDRSGRIIPEDKYASKSFPGYVDKFKPDLVWTLGDSLAGERVIPVKINGKIDLIPFFDLWDLVCNESSQFQIGEDGIEREFIKISGLNILTLSHLGWKKINVISRHLFKGNLAYIEQPKGHTACTFNHSVMIIDGGISRKAIPEETIEHELLNIEVIEDEIKKCDIVENEKTNTVLARLCGAYISEGSLSDTKCGRRLRISSTDINWLKKLQDDVELIYHKRGSIEKGSQIKNGGSCDCYNLVIWGMDIFNWFKDNCGRYSEGKKVPSLVFNGNEKVIKEFLRLAYEGDGYDGTEISYTTKSLKLASGISFLHKMLGEKVSIRYRDEKESYTVRRIYEDRKVREGVYRLESFEYDGFVYDLTVEEAHTFVDALGCVVCCNTWMTDHVVASPSRKSFKWVGYFPIDGEPVPSKWGKVVENMDIAVAYGKYGKNVISKRVPNAKLTYIHHGVNTSIFYPRDEKQKIMDREAILGPHKNKKIIGIVARNQPRKAFDKLFEAYFYILNGKYIICKSCNQITLHPYSIIEREFKYITQCKHCRGTDIYQGKPREDVSLYLHAAAADCGWELIDLQNDYDLTGKILINPSLKIGVGVDENTLAAIFNTFTIFTLPTRGEGFGLPILEAMACGVPTVVSDYSAHTEWVSGCGELVPPIAMVAEPLTNIRRAIIDIDLYVTALIKLLDDPKLCEQYGKNGIEQAKKMDWNIIVKKWEKLIDGILYSEGIPEIVNPTDIEYSLEEV